MKNWKFVSLGEICDVNKNSFTKNDKYEYINYLDTGNITENKINDILRIDDLSLIPTRAKRKIQKNDVIFSTVRPNQKHYGIIKKPIENMICSTGFAVISGKKDILDNRFLYYYLSQDEIVNYLQVIAENSVSVYPSIKPTDITKLKIKLPEITEQRKIADILDSLSNKIEYNSYINQNLEAQAQAIFKSWFVDFEPFGKKKPEDWKEYRLGDFLPIITGKKNANVSSQQGKYPFFSCAQDIAWTENFSFDANAILVAGNGDFNVKFYNGKFEAYQRTYVLIPYNPKLTNWLYYVVKYNLGKITSGARGSVIKFITKGNLENFSFFAPSNLNDLDLIDFFNSANNKIAENKLEILQLSQLRDALLPKLMSGEIDVSEVAV